VPLHREGKKKLQQRRLEPPPPANTIVSLHSSHRRSIPPPFSYSFFSFVAWLPLFCKMNSGEWINSLSIVCFMFLELKSISPTQNDWAGSGPIQKQNFQKNIFENLWFFRVFFYWISLNIGLYFYTVKIQIQFQNTQFS
jgi:hypothetical protein